MSKPAALSAITHALRPHVRDEAREIAAAALAGSVREAIYPSHGGKKGGASFVSERRKTLRFVTMRNATLQWNRLFNEVAAGMLLITTVPVSPVFLGLAGLLIVSQLRALVRRDLDERHGAVVYVLWLTGGQNTAQSLERLQPEVSRELRRLGKPRMSKRELEEKLSDLAELECLIPTIAGWRLKTKVWLTV